MTTKDFIQHIRERIARDELAEALRLLRGLLDNAPKLDEAILQSARFQDFAHRSGSARSAPRRRI